MNVQLNVSFSAQQLVDAIKQLSPREKLQIRDMLEEDMEVPAEHQRLVLDRIKKARKDPGRLQDWDKASKKLKS